ncbi:thioredoxin domain-containing protein [Vibrio ziniensis]|uniref:Thiol:disulfide interchange protein DsbA/DsbL n=1 Tax=Vibrio ziniensis TaxID=2711221 RepID=A0A6G7CQQ4_9VIBR|nr:thiol:disulfide interchange protein DsbA/DsbL [Vibrio ziniensis]QIH44393.1 thiol:disulfide interchange protein DsbA/DsbL [Vibrio ziniensis]
MKKLLTGFINLFTLVFILAGCSDNSTPVEGEQYQLLPANLSTYRLAPVTEIFSLTCGHCRKMESIIPELENLTSEHFGKLHVTFNEGAKIGAMIYYTAVMQLGNIPDAAMMEELFAAVQMGEGSTLTDRQAAIEKAFTDRNLATPYHLTQEQQSKVLGMIQTANKVSQDGEIKAVPTFVVKGKYQVITSGHKDVEGIAKTISYLLTQP